jgi:iron complex outermembrane receptor protein
VEVALPTAAVASGQQHCGDPSLGIDPSFIVSGDRDMQLSTQRFIASLCAVLVVCTGMSTGLRAQELEEIVVTARQRAEKLTDVPASITAFTADVIERANIERAEDFVYRTPGVSLVDTAEVGDTQVSIRGINGSRDAEANFAFIVDGILHTNPSAFNREFADLQQIEVLKGPQGAIYGRSASAGAIIVTTRKPADELEASVKGSVGNDGGYFASGVVSGGLTDTLAGRLHVDWRNHDGFYSNSFHSDFLGKDDEIVDDFENYNVNGRLVWEPTDSLSVDFRAHYGEVDAASISFNAAFALPVFGFIPRGDPLWEDVNEHPFVFQANVDPSNEQESLDFSLKVDYEMEWATLTAWTLYSDVDQNFLADGTSGAFGFFAAEPNCVASAAAIAALGVPFPPPTFNSGNPAPGASFYGAYTPATCDGYQYQVRNQEDVSFEMRLTSPDDERLRWQGGFYYLNLDRQVGVATLVDPTPVSVLTTEGSLDLPTSLINPLTEALVYDDFDTEVWAVFGQLAYDVTDDLEASVALRYDHEAREVHSLVPPPGVQRSNFVDYTTGFLLFPLGAAGCEDGIAGSPLNPAYVDFATCTTLNGIPDRDKSFEELQPKISLRWNANDIWTFFASWGVGFKSGGFNNQGSKATIDLFFNNPAIGAAVGMGGAGLSIEDEFAEETSSAFEVGFKSVFLDGRLNMEGALYYTEVDDMQIFNFFVGPFGLLRVVSNIDEVQIAGGEFALSVQLTDAWNVYGGIAITNARIEKNSNRPQTVGNRVPYSPEFTASLGTEYIRPTMWDGIEFVGRVDYNMVGSTWFAEPQRDDQTLTLFTPFGFGLADWSLAQRDAYGVMDVRTGLKGDRWGAFITVKNLLDENYLAEVIPAPEFGGSFIHPGAERQWAVEVSYSFF